VYALWSTPISAAASSWDWPAAFARRAQSRWEWRRISLMQLPSQLTHHKSDQTLQIRDTIPLRIPSTVPALEGGTNQAVIAESFLVVLHPVVVEEPLGIMQPLPQRLSELADLLFFKRRLWGTNDMTVETRWRFRHRRL
jgi:hypothetical protein